MIYGNLPASHWEKNTRPTAFVCVFGWFPSWLLHLASYLKPSHSKKNLSNHICLPDGRFLLFALICQQKQLTLDSMQPPARIMPGILVSLLRSSHTVALTLTHPHMHWLIHTKRERERESHLPASLQCHCHFGQELVKGFSFDKCWLSGRLGWKIFSHECSPPSWRTGCWFWVWFLCSVSGLVAIRASKSCVCTLDVWNWSRPIQSSQATGIRQMFPICFQHYPDCQG